MTRKEEIIEHGISYTLQVCPVCIAGDAFSDAMRDFNRNKAFEAGAKWADEHPNLEYLWHDASEEPTTEDTWILATNEKDIIDVYHLHKGRKYNFDGNLINWSSIVVGFNLTKWAYIKDILPKGGEK